MKYRIMNNKLFPITDWFNDFRSASTQCIDTMPQAKVWFIEDENLDTVCIVHCENIWFPESLDEMENELEDENESKQL